MKVSGFSIIRNASKYNYPVRESILSILPVCDEFIVNVGDSEDETLSLVESIGSPKIKILKRNWDMSLGEKALSVETDYALKECTGDWAFYLQGDEVIHQSDLPILCRYMRKYLNDKSVEGFKLRWLHFYGSFYRYRVDAGWFQKQVRIIRNNGNLQAQGDAWGFERKDGFPLRAVRTRCFLYHYGWVNTPALMAKRIENASKLGYSFTGFKREEAFDYKNIERLPVYFGRHPKVMEDIVNAHELSRNDLNRIKRKYFWNPLLWFRIRYKTGKRIKKNLPV